MQIGGPQIQIDQRNRLAAVGNQSAQAGGDETLANSAFAPAYGIDFRHRPKTNNPVASNRHKSILVVVV